MRPHTVLDDMLKVEKMLGNVMEKNVDLALWDNAKQALANAVTFDFQANAPTTEHVEFGTDLLDRGVFRLPFPSTFYCGTALGRNHAVVVTTVDLKGLDDPEEDRAPYLASYLIVEAITEIGSFLLPTYAVYFCTKDAMDKPAPFLDVLKCNNVRRSTGEVMTKDDRLAAAGRGFNFVLGAASMLLSKDVSTNKTSAPTKLNAQRAQKGRSPIGDVHTIKIAVSAAARYAEAGRNFGSHASPKMHWRRGHFRTLRRGDDGEMVIPVAPCLVGAGPGGAKDMAPKEYIIGSGEAA